MKPPTDHLIDQVLTGLGNAQPPANMRSRLHATLAQRQAEAPTRPTFWSRFTFLNPRAIAAFTTAALAAGILIAILHPRQQPNNSALSLRPKPAVLAPTRPTPTLSPFAIQQPPSDVSSRPKAALVAAEVERPLYSHSSAPSPSSSDFDTVAAAEAAAPSQAPPPLPMTSEERLIHRFFELNSATVLAALTPPMQLLHERQEEEDYRAFFAPPTPPPLPAAPGATTPTPARANAPEAPCTAASPITEQCHPEAQPKDLLLPGEPATSAPVPAASEVPAPPQSSSPQPAVLTQGDRP